MFWQQQQKGTYMLRSDPWYWHTKCMIVRYDYYHQWRIYTLLEYKNIGTCWGVTPCTQNLEIIIRLSSPVAYGVRAGLAPQVINDIAWQKQQQQKSETHCSVTHARAPLAVGGIGFWGSNGCCPSTASQCMSKPGSIGHTGSDALATCGRKKAPKNK